MKHSPGQGFNSYTQEIRLENAVNIPRKSTTVLSTSDTVQLVRLPSTSKINGAVAREAPLSNGKPGDTAAFGTANPDDHKVEPNGGLQSKFANAQVIKDTDDAIFNPAGTDMSGVFSIPEQIPVVSQSVTYSTRAIENVR